MDKIDVKMTLSTKSGRYERGQVKMKLVETRRIDTDRVRQMCIENDYYTMGTNEEYSRMFKKCDLGYNILDIAKDIFEHSNKEKLMYQSGSDEREVLENICYGLINDCCYTCVDIEE